MSNDFCRICRRSGTSSHPLISPCACSGSIKYVHLHCLARWIRISNSIRCEICLQYIQVDSDRQQDRLVDLLMDILSTLFIMLPARIIYFHRVLRRIMIVPIMWLIVIPCTVLCIWKFYFLLGASYYKTIVQSLSLSDILKLNDEPSHAFLLLWKDIPTWAEDYIDQYTIQSFIDNCLIGLTVTFFSMATGFSFILLYDWTRPYLPYLENSSNNEDSNQFPLPGNGPPSPVARSEDFLPEALREQQNIPNLRSLSMPPINHASLDRDYRQDQHYQRAQSLEPSVLDVLQNQRYSRRSTATAPDPLPTDPRVHQDIDTATQNNMNHFPASINDFPSNEHRVAFLCYIFGINSTARKFIENCCEIVGCIMVWLSVAILLPYILGATFILTGLAAGKILKKFLGGIDVYLNESITSYLSDFWSPIYQKYVEIPNGETTMDIIWCLILGYLMTFFLVFVIHLFLNNGSIRRKYGQRTHSILQTNMLVFKTCFFLYIVPSIACIFRGFLLDYLTLPLFEHATLDSRISYLKSNILSSLFIHFLAGLILKIHYFFTVVYIRKFVRPGLVWFIQTPNDEYFRPIENITQYQSLVYLSKLLKSYLFDFFMMAVRIGGTLKLVEMFTPDLFPLRCPGNPVFVIPLDLLIIVFITPLTFDLLNYNVYTEVLLQGCLTFFCKQLRLSSFVLGWGDYEEMGVFVYHNFTSWLTRKRPLYNGNIFRRPISTIEDDVSFVWEGQFLRVPYHDDIPEFSTRRMLVPIDKTTFRPLDPLEERLGHPALIQDINTDTEVVYSPPYLKLRLFLLLMLMFLVQVLLVYFVYIGPIVYGRYVFKHDLGFKDNVHDIYSYLVGGSSILGATALIINFVTGFKGACLKSSVIEKILHLSDHYRCLFFTLLKNGYTLIFYVILLPLLTGALFETYIVFPSININVFTYSADVIIVWIEGFAIVTIMRLIKYHSRRFRVRMSFGLIILIELAMLLIPAFLTALVIHIFKYNNPEIQTRIIQIAYPLTFVSLFSIYCFYTGLPIRQISRRSRRARRYLRV